MFKASQTTLHKIIITTGIVFSGISVSIVDVHAEDRVCIVNDKGETVCGRVKTSASPTVKKPSQKMKVIDKDYSITFLLDKCSRVESTVQCVLSMKNQGSEQQFSISPQSSKIVDSKGRTYPGFDARYANVTASEQVLFSGEIRLFPNIDYPISLRFNNVPEDVTKVPLLIISTRRGGNGSSHELHFRNVVNISD